mgnify:CR=1 FL=1
MIINNDKMIITMNLNYYVRLLLINIILIAFFVLFFVFRYTMVFIFYAIATVVMILIRPKYCPHGKMSVYAGLYFYPILAFFQAVFGGIICK